MRDSFSTGMPSFCASAAALTSAPAARLSI
jgi:hypothetical protein